MLDSELGFWVYSTPIGTVAGKNLPSDEEVLTISDNFVAQSGLYNGELGKGIISYITTGDGSIVDSDEIVQKQVFYYPQINNLDVYGVYRLIVGVGEGGKITYVSKQLYNTDVLANVKLKNVGEIKAEIESKNYVANNNMPIENAKIISCKLVYYSDIMPNNGMLYIHPVYELVALGESYDGDAEEFAILIDAAK